VGRVLVFQKNGEEWRYYQTLFAFDTGGLSEFGSTVDIYGNHIVVGARYAGPLPKQGSAYVFRKYLQIDYTEEERLTHPHPSSGDQFGESVAIYEDALIIGCPYEDSCDTTGDLSQTSCPNGGVVFAYNYDAGSWDLEGMFMSKVTSGEAESRFGFSLDLFGDLAVIGAFRAQGGEGRAFLVNRNSGRWDQLLALTAETPTSNAEFGFDVSLSDNNHTVIISEP